MIVSIKGKITETASFQVVVDVQGIGYAVNVPLTTTEVLPPIGSEVYLHTHAVYKEDSHALYGFKRREERDFFQLIIEKVSGVGPKIALGVMSRLSLPILKDAIARGDVTLLSQCSGIGKKTAERLTLELRDKIFPTPPSTVPFQANAAQSDTNLHEDAVAALVKLGLNASVADKSVRKALLNFKEAAPSIEELVKKALG